MQAADEVASAKKIEIAHDVFMVQEVVDHDLLHVPGVHHPLLERSAGVQQVFLDFVNEWMQPFAHHRIDDEHRNCSAQCHNPTKGKEQERNEGDDWGDEPNDRQSLNRDSVLISYDLVLQVWGKDGVKALPLFIVYELGDEIAAEGAGVVDYVVSIEGV